METDPSFEIRQLSGHDEYLACEALEKETWGVDFSECVPPAILMISQKMGGVTAGAFDDGGRLVGFVYGITGVQNGKLVHWSHMLAVRPQLRDVGLGTRLKVFQKQQVRALGVEAIFWTFDPLVAKNAHINLNHLGTKIEEYVVDMYIDGNESDLHRGLGMDRFIVKWPLGDLDRQDSDARAAREIHKPPVVNTEIDQAGQLVLRDPVKTDAMSLCVEIPHEIHRIQSDSLDLAGAWRENTRKAFTHFMNKGYSVTGFRRNPETNRCFYHLAKQSGSR